MPWLCGGDFIEILHSKEKRGGIPRNAGLMMDFKQVINDNNLEDLRWSGPQFTWSNKRYGLDLIEERLDRFLCNSKWEKIFRRY